MASKPQQKVKGKKSQTKPSQGESLGKRLRKQITDDMTGFVIGLALMVLSAFMFVSMISNVTQGKYDQAGIEAGNLTSAANFAGVAGAQLSYMLMNKCFGFCSILIAVFLLMVSVRLMKAYKPKLWSWFLNLTLLMVWGSVALSIVWDILGLNTTASSLSFPPGGIHGDYLRNLLYNSVGKFITIVILLIIAVLYLAYRTRKTIEVVRHVLHPINKNKQESEDCGEGNLQEGEQTTDFDSAHTEAPDAEPEELQEQEPGEVPAEPVMSQTPTPPKQDAVEFKINKAGEKDAPAERNIVAEKLVNLERYDPRKEFERYKFPTLDLLKHFDTSEERIDVSEQQANKERIIDVLRSFGVEIESINATVGPTITLYEIKPARGVKITKIRNLEDDIALSLSALGIRIIAPIPGKGTIGIEVPNRKPQIVSMESILNTKKFQETKYDLPVALGRTITNEVFMIDLAKAPHLLVAGATGQGKSVGLNAIITSLLYKKHPAEVKFVMVDPKKVEFSIYSSLEKYFMAMLPDQDDPIITDVTKVIQTLKSLCTLMDHRYDLLKMARVRNIKEYNEKFMEHKLNPENGHEYMPYIVIIIDEFGDLIMTAGKEIELPIARIAQLARAVGMHMVIATQRPTTNIITGTIKANFPARMAFKVMSTIDSMTILDRKGANQLVGRGDMLILTGQSGSDPVRVQCAFVDTPEVENITEFISDQDGYLAPYQLPEADIESGDITGGGGSGLLSARDLQSNDLDDMFEDVARLVVVHQSGSTSLIQRKFSIGYNRAGRLMDQLERTGIVGPQIGSKPRDVLCQDETALQQVFENLKAM